LPLHIILCEEQYLRRILKKMTLSQNEMTPYIRKIQQKFDEAQTFLVKNGFHQATKGLLQDIENANGINTKTK
tara:strand:+ start:459 stop:677 length:219 start_codon:yes stop_codon:yes gene_type:complete